MAKFDPLQGMTLEKILIALHEQYGWQELGSRIDIRCFNFDPSIKSSLKFLRKTPWARSKVEQLYIEMAIELLKPEPEPEPEEQTQVKDADQLVNVQPSIEKESNKSRFKF